MVVVTLLFSANLFGVFSIRLSSNATTKLATAGGKGMRGHFMEGMFATLLATPVPRRSSAPPLRLRWWLRIHSCG